MRRLAVAAAARRAALHWGVAAGLGCGFGFAAGAAGAAAPTLEHLYPAGGAAGSTHLVALSGKFDPWPVRFWVEGEGVSFLARTNAGKVDVIVAPGTTPGPRLVRVFHDDGASDPRFFVVGAGPELADQEPNDRFTAPQVVAALPVTVNGRLDRNGDVDSFAVKLRAGEWLEARLDAFVLMSKVDPVLRLVSGEGRQLAWNHDFAAFDPRIAWQAPDDATVVVQVFGFRYPADSSIVLGGGEGTVYRLHLATSERPPELDLGAPVAELEPSVESGTAPGTGTGIAKGTIQDVTPPLLLGGVIGSGADEDRFQFASAKDQTWEIEVTAMSAGSPLDAWLRVEDAAGKELAFADDSDSGRDPRLEWKAPGDGSYRVVVGSRTHQGGPGHRYRLGLRRAIPDFRVRSAAGAFVVDAGATNEVKATLTRLHGFTNALEAVFRELPEGVTAAAVPAPAGNGSITLKLVAGVDAPAFNGPVRLVMVDAVAGTERGVPWDLVSAGENNGVPQGWSRLVIERTDQLWLTVRPKRTAP